MSRPRACPDETLLLVATAVRDGMPYRALAAQLTADGVPTPGGRVRWYPPTITKLLQTAAGRAVLDALDR
ncbi:hypothetical protein [Paractinoplanes atraurantiacus]|uniref:Recombinase n=1 Tax=Paractinoplanes atraurantiacus TaxID=1036182 RepID=A0A285IWT4_9ACTN|nr:hypothetical protein [Actinoplanes atraurantiacus]SNY52499.1 hypothetical protein SAMN05421748_11317 [Actinoplanes atraurantiacus]